MAACTLSNDTVSQVKEASNNWLETNSKESLDAAVYALLDLTKSGDLKVSHFASCTLGDLLARNNSNVDAYGLLSECVKAFDFKTIKHKVYACDEHNPWDLETGLWNAHLAGQLGRILLRYNKGREALEQLYIAEKFLQKEHQPYIYKYNANDVEVVKNALDGFKGLILRTTFEYSKSEQYLANGLKLISAHESVKTESGQKLILLGSEKLRWWQREDVREMYINYGDIVARKSHSDLAYKVYLQGYERGLFSHPAQRSVVEVKDPFHGQPLTSKAVWKRGLNEKVDLVMNILEEHSDALLREAKSLLSRSTMDHNTALSSSSSSSSSPSFSNTLTNTLNQLASSMGYSPMPGFANANSMLLQAESSMFSSVWWRALFRLGLPSVWSQFFLYEHGYKDHANCKLAPISCGIIESLGAKLNVQGDAKFSLMAPGTQVHPHCGPTNGRLRIHLGLMVAPQDVNKMGIFVGPHTTRNKNNALLLTQANNNNIGKVENGDSSDAGDDFDDVDIISHASSSSSFSSNIDTDASSLDQQVGMGALELLRWESGKAFCFDDSFEHSVYHNGSFPRLVLILDILHPDIQESIEANDDETKKEKKEEENTVFHHDLLLPNKKDHTFNLKKYYSKLPYPLPEIGPPLSVVRNNVKAYPEQAKRLGLKPPPTNVKEFILENESLHTFAFIVSLIVLLYVYWKLALSPQIQKLKDVMERRRLAKQAKIEARQNKKDS